MKIIIIYSLLGDYSRVAEVVEKGTEDIQLSKLDNLELRKLVVRISAENEKIKKENKLLQEENEKITDTANRVATALAELKQGISDAVDVSEAYYKEQ